jgi:hypothetical protein
MKVRPQRVGLLKFVAGFGLLCGFWYDNRMALTGSLLFFWLLIADWAPRCGSGYSNRLLLALLSAVFSLQLFPMAGEQVDWASLMPIAAAGVLLAEGFNLLAGKYHNILAAADCFYRSFSDNSTPDRRVGPCWRNGCAVLES